MVFSNNLLACSGGQSTGYEIDQSIRFNKSASALMSRTFGTATDRNVFTYAFWMKACSESNRYHELLYNSKYKARKVSNNSTRRRK